MRAFRLFTRVNSRTRNEVAINTELSAERHLQLTLTTTPTPPDSSTNYSIPSGLRVRVCST